jgi:Sulfotransferase domain
MESLGLYPLSNILSYLNEVSGVSLLLTKRSFARNVLPVFRLPRDALGIETLHRHHFRPVPVQDPPILLDRLNTRRLRKRRRPFPSGLSTTELSLQEWHSNLSRFPDPPENELLRFLVSDRRSEFYPCLTSGPTLIVSYPRSGNTLVRTLLERTTGIVVGSDTRPDRSLSRELAEQHGLTGEGVSQGAFVKTHWPERVGNRKFVGQRAILLVRNPYDAIDSYWNMNATKSHTKTVTVDVYARHSDKWQGLVQNEIHIWNQFLEYWIRSAECPVLVVRFEDLIRDPAVELTHMLEFALQKELSSFWRDRIHHATNSCSTAQLGSYQPRSANKGVESVGKSIRNGRFSPEQLDFIRTTSTSYSENYLSRFGYDMVDQAFPSNFTADREPKLDDRSVARKEVNVSICVNDGDPIRPATCPYGRLLQKWRHSVTNNDEDPLPTVGS